MGTKTLAVIGVLLLLAGIAVAALSGGAVNDHTRVAQYEIAMYGSSVSGGAIAQAQLGVWLGVAGMIVGAVLLIASGVIVAARSDNR
jgi:glycerol uptake facilitator-like aquaporin